MKPVRAKIPLSYRLTLFAVLLTLWITGVSLYLFQKYIRVSGEFGLTYHSSQVLFRQIHGAAAFTMMIIYGYLLASHVSYGWKQKRQRKLGVTLVLVQLSIIITGYMVYYVGNDFILHTAATTHLLLGLSFPLLLISHIYLVIRSKSSKTKTKKLSV